MWVFYLASLLSFVYYYGGQIPVIPTVMIREMVPKISIVETKQPTANYGMPAVDRVDLNWFLDSLSPISSGLGPRETISILLIFMANGWIV